MPALIYRGIRLHEVSRVTEIDTCCILSVESQKGVMTIQRCSVENQKGAIVVQSLW